MLTNEVKDLLNDQINKELYSAYLYLDMSNYYADEGLNGFSNWYFVQAKEEMDHAMLFRQYLLNNGCKVTFEAVHKPSEEFNAFDDPLKIAFSHEQYVTGLINNIYDYAYKAKDFRTMQFLDWFVKEQGEEEKNADDLIKKFQLFGSDSKSLYMMDNELGGRVYNPPTLVLD